MVTLVLSHLHTKAYKKLPIETKNKENFGFILSYERKMLKEN